MKKALPKFRDQMTSNWPYKLVSGLVALVLWLSILWGKKDNVLLKSVTVDFGVPSSFVLLEDANRKVTLKLAGPRAALRRIGPTSSFVSINLPQVFNGENLVQIQEQQLNLPQGVRLLSTDPEVIHIKVVEKDARTKGSSK